MSIENDSNKSKRQKSEVSTLDRLKALTVVVADTGEINTIQAYSPEDATTNPSLIYKASLMSEYQSLIDDAIKYALANNHPEDLSSIPIDIAMDRLAVNFGLEISKLVPGYVSTEVDARLSFNTQATIDRARRIIRMYKELGVDKSKILIKIAATYEGIRAGEILENEGISCNLTLVFSLVQAAACAEANITLISPFVGRILDWYKAKTGKTYTASEDPGVKSVTDIYNYMRKFNYNTIVMGASFRSMDEVLELAGCDRLTISPAILQELKSSDIEVPRKLHPFQSDNVSISKLSVDEPSFRFALNEDAMATEKLSEGIRQFSSDLRKLEEVVIEKLNKYKH